MRAEAGDNEGFVAGSWTKQRICVPGSVEWLNNIVRTSDEIVPEASVAFVLEWLDSDGRMSAKLVGRPGRDGRLVLLTKAG